MRLFVALLAMLVAGCATKEVTPAPVPSETGLAEVNKRIDEMDSKISASIAVARDANKAGMPKKVEAELSVASAFLPKPSEDDLRLAQARADKEDSGEYQSSIKKAEAQNKEFEDGKVKLEKQVKDNQELIAKREKKIEELERQIEEKDQNLWTMAGVGLFVLGAVCCGLLGWKVGAPIIICAPIAGAAPYIYASEFFVPTIITAIVITLLLGLWRLWDYIRDKNDEPNPGPPA
ncbi:hypothetical protein UFOVP543_21 [uncultured Caudovirales phage]|uniref:Uncharacterized protein n=1 Tax=uncultured Caudovirales phage TaxID=2100421 RepID=A0A6J5P1A7_9CAUD|nr:hypothetical protein UFOVP543_21 [uncultured Caudovirales phage]CAB4163756.1 hypothetical protein UFOVP804_49 [uncultured Caudovirales phage]